MKAAAPMPHMTVAGSDLPWLMAVLYLLQDTYAVRVVHALHPLSTLRMFEDGRPAGAIVVLSPQEGSMEVREMLERSPGVRFVFVAASLPLRSAVARVIRQEGHAVVSADEPLVVIAATAAALMAKAGAGA